MLLSKIVHELARAEDVDSGQVVGSRGVVVVSMDGEDRQAHVQVRVQVIGLPEAIQ